MKTAELSPLLQSQGVKVQDDSLVQGKEVRGDRKPPTKKELLGYVLGVRSTTEKNIGKLPCPGVVDKVLKIPLKSRVTPQGEKAKVQQDVVRKSSGMRPDGTHSFPERRQSLLDLREQGMLIAETLLPVAQTCKFPVDEGVRVPSEYQIPDVPLTGKPDHCGAPSAD